jgi:hypothetical protein
MNDYEYDAGDPKNGASAATQPVAINPLTIKEYEA